MVDNGENICIIQKKKIYSKNTAGKNVLVSEILQILLHNTNLIQTGFYNSVGVSFYETVTVDNKKSPFRGFN
jgi:hypothetical protein